VQASDLAVVIPTRSRWELLLRNIEALRGQTVQGFETIVVVDGLDQDAPDLSPARVLTKEHAGPGAARNYGAARTDRALVMFLGDDTIPDPNLVERHLEGHRAEPAAHVGVLGLVVWHDDVANHPINRWLDWSGLQFEYAKIEGDDAGATRLYTSNVSLKREIFQSVGGFDEDFFFLYEDIDLGARLRQIGFQLRLDRAAITRHLHPYTWPDIERRFVTIARSEHLMTQKHPDFRPWFRPQIASAAAQGTVVVPWERIVPWLPARSGIRARLERRVTRRYLQRLAPAFEAAWQEADHVPVGGPSA
jgi:GT2 family glycosyltransferase